MFQQTLPEELSVTLLLAVDSVFHDQQRILVLVVLGTLLDGLSVALSLLNQPGVVLVEFVLVVVGGVGLFELHDLLAAVVGVVGCLHLLQGVHLSLDVL